MIVTDALPMPAERRGRRMHTNVGIAQVATSPPTIAAVVEGGPVKAQQTRESPMSCTSDRKMVPSPFLKYLVHACVYRKPYPQ